MKKSLLITIVVLIVILILPAAGFVGWFFKEKKPLNVVILDKTVHSLEREKHRSLTWVLANSRIVKKDNKKKYLLRKDYYGFYPIKPLRSKQFRRNDFRLADLIDLADNNDVIYYADTYGVFFNDWYKGINRSRRSRKLYGGLNNNDYLLLAEMRKRDKLVILEYNTFDYPTNAFERYRVEEDQLNIKHSGWTGQYYASLDSIDVEFWMLKMYQKQYNEPWNFSNAGIVFFKGENEMVVLEEGIHLNNALPYVVTDDEVAAKYGVATKVPYSGPFDVMDAKENRSLSSFSLDVTDAGADILYNKFLEPVFPAVIVDNNSGHTIYMCGDFASGTIAPWTACFGSLNIIKGLLYGDDVNDTRRFFWLYYKPLLSGIMDEYYNSLDK